jgi:hypothetical protein
MAARRGCAFDEADIQPFLDKRRPGQQIHHAAAGTRSGPHPLRHVRRPDHRHPDQPDDRECRPAFQGLFRGRQGLSPRPCRLQPTTPNTAFATIAAAGAARRARRLRGSRRVRSPGCDTRSRNPRLMSSRLAAMRSTAPISKRARSARTRSSAPMRPPPGGGRRLVDEARKAGSSLGAVVECVATGVPPGWGAPLYAKLDSRTGRRDDGDQRGQGVEIGDGFEAARFRGEQNADPMRPGTNQPVFLANNAGGIAGGISTGQPVVCALASSRPARS